MSSAHSDDLAVDAFAEAMKAKLARKRDAGYGGWRDQCSIEFLSAQLRKHVEKGDPVDVANFAMMLQQRGARIEPIVVVPHDDALEAALLAGPGAYAKYERERVGTATMAASFALEVLAMQLYNDYVVRGANSYRGAPRWTQLDPGQRQSWRQTAQRTASEQP